MGAGAEMAMAAEMAYPGMDPLDAHDALISDLVDEAEGNKPQGHGAMFLSYVESVNDLQENDNERDTETR